MADKEILEEAKDAFKKCEDAESDNRDRALDDLRFARLSEQWPEGIKRQREIDGRPCLTINRMPAFIRQVVNDARLNKPAINIHPVDDNADPDTAKILQGLIRNIEVSSNAEVAYDTGLDNAVSCGFGYWRVDYDYACDDTFDMDLMIERIANPFTVYGDYRSTAADSSDWDVAFITETLSHDEFEAQYKGAEKVSWETVYTDSKDQDWFTDDSVRVAEYWTRDKVDATLLKLDDGQVMYADMYEQNKNIFDAAGVVVLGERPTQTFQVKQKIVTAAEVLEETEWKGRYIPIVPVYGEEISVEGRRYFRSMIHDARDSQMMYNLWRSTSTELVALAPKAPWVGPAGAFETDSEKWATANRVSHSHIEYDGNIPPQRQPFAGVPAGALQEALNASDDMKSVMGMYDASLGARSNETSGRAIMARQREGDISTFHFIDNLSRAIRHTGLILVDLIPHIYSEARIARVLGEDETAEVVPINQPVPVMDDMGQPQMDERGEPVTRIYDLTTGKYDVTVKAGPSFTTKREEASTQMMELLRTFPDAAPVIGDLVAKNLDWPGADEIAERLESLLPNHLKGGNPAMAALQEQLMMAEQALQEAQSTQAAEAAKLEVERLKVEIDAQKAAMEAEKARAEIELKTRELALREAEAMKPLPDDSLQVVMKREEMEFEADQNERDRQVDLAKAVISKSDPVEDVSATAMQQAAALMAAPKRVVRDEMGNVVGVETVAQ